MTCGNCGESGIHSQQKLCPQCGATFPTKTLPFCFNGWLLAGLALLGIAITGYGVLLMAGQMWNLHAPDTTHALIVKAGCTLFGVALVMGIYALLRRK